MTSPLADLKGQTVTEVIEIHDYLQLHFGDAIGISIYNPVEICPSSALLVELLGQTVDTVIECSTRIELVFDDDLKIRIDMRPEAFRGPEALQLNRTGKPPVIWN